MKFNKFSVSARAACPFMPRGKDTTESTIYGVLKCTDGLDEACHFTNCSFLIHKCNNYKGHRSYESGLFNPSCHFSIIITVITLSTHIYGNLSILKFAIRDPDVRIKIQNATLKQMKAQVLNIKNFGF